MTQREFWAAIEARTSKEVADMGFLSVNENDIPGTRMDEDEDVVTCADLDVAAAAMQQMYDDSLSAAE